MGIPSTIHVDHCIQQARSGRSLGVPGVLRRRLEISYWTQQACQYLGNQASSPTGLHPDPHASILLFSQELTAIEGTPKDQGNDPTSIALLAARLHILSFGLGNNASSQGGRLGHTLTFLDEVCLHAGKLVHLATLPENDGTTWTMADKRAVLVAVIVLLKIRAVAPMTTQRKLELSNHIAQGWRFLHGLSTRRYDHMHRVCATIDFLSKNDAALKVNRVRARMSANFIFDFSWSGRQRFAPNIRAERHHDYTKADEDQREREREDAESLGMFAGFDDFLNDNSVASEDASIWESTWQDVLNGTRGIGFV
jgi:hypothetical protein